MPIDVTLARDEPGLWNLVKPFVLWGTIGATLVFAATFAALCAYECTVAPWFKLVIAPLIAGTVGIVLAVRAYRRATSQAPAQKVPVLVVLLTSFFWAPVVFGMALSVVQVAFFAFARG
jgi:hypothetical protein